MAEQNDRIRKSISIIGLNTSASDLNAQDGTCERLHNLRYSAGSLRPVPRFRLRWSIAGYNGFRIVYRHPAASEERYIAIDQNQALHEVRVDCGKVASTQLLAENLDDFRFCNHFGNVLIVRAGNTDQRYFVLNDGQYREFRIPQPPILRPDLKSSTGIPCTYVRDMYSQYIPIDTDNTAEYEVLSVNYRVMNISTGEVLVPVNNGKDDFWHGEILVFAAYRMTDGTAVATSPLYLLHSDKANDDSVISKQNNNLDKSDKTNVFLEIMHGPDLENNPQNPLYYVTPRLLRCKPRIFVTINKAEVDASLISEVAIYSTRVNTIYDYEGIAKGRLTDKYYIGQNMLFTDTYADNKLPKQPFYLIKEINISEFDENGAFDFELGYSLLKDIVSKPAYEPVQSLHKVVGNVFYDYNNRMHFGDTTTTLFEGYDLAETEYDDYIDTYVMTTLKSGGKTYSATKKYIDAMFVKYTGNILSYPDYRANEVRVVREFKMPSGSTFAKVGQAINLLPAVSLNYAYYIPQPENRLKYPDISAFTTIDEHEKLVLSDNRQIIERNRVQVSAPNNIFVYPYAQSYAFGRPDETIVMSLASTADQLSEGRFGMHPLYVFTSSGVWAMENGQGEVLYSHVIPVNHDVISNPNCASARNAVFYITPLGLHAVQGRESRLVSASLEDRLDVLYDYFQNAVLRCLFNMDELVVYNRTYDYAYVYSLSAGYWSTRDMRGTILECDEIISGKNIYDLQEDDATKCLPLAHIVTRPIKFESVEFKRLETLIIRLSSESNIYTELLVEGSQDCKQWFPLRSETLPRTRQDITIRRTSISAKFFRITLTMNVVPGLCIDRFDTEFYHRFVRRLR